MATNTTFIDFVTPVPADWLNNVNATANAFNSIIFYGADPTGVQDSTNAIQTALNTLSQVEIPAGTYKCGYITVNNPSLRAVTSRGRAVILPSNAVSTGGGFTSWWVFNNLSGAVISGLRFQAPSTTYPGLIVLSANTCTNTTIIDNMIVGSGYTGISMAIGTQNRVSKNYITDWLGNGIVLSGSSPTIVDNGTEVDHNYIQGNGATSIAHGVSITYAISFNVHNNNVQAAGTFGYGARFANFATFHDNISHNSVHEGVNVEDSNFIKIDANVLTWDAQPSNPGTDFGISIFGNTQSIFGNEVLNNQVVNSASSGICVTAGTVSTGAGDTMIRGNQVFNCNQKKAAVAGGVDNKGGIIISGTLSTGNIVTGNAVIDNGINALTYGIADFDAGLGAGASSEFVANRIFAQNNFAGGSALLTGTNTKTTANTGQY